MNRSHARTSASVIGVVPRPSVDDDLVARLLRVDHHGDWRRWAQRGGGAGGPLRASQIASPMAIMVTNAATTQPAVQLGATSHAAIRCHARRGDGLATGSTASAC